MVLIVHVTKNLQLQSNNHILNLSNVPMLFLLYLIHAILSHTELYPLDLVFLYNYRMVMMLQYLLLLLWLDLMMMMAIQSLFRTSLTGATGATHWVSGNRAVETPL